MASKLVQNVLAPLAIAGTLFFTNPDVSAQETARDNAETERQFTISSGLGLYGAKNQQIQDVYGVVPKINLNFGTENKENNLGFKGHLSYGWRKGQPEEDISGDIQIESESEVRMFQFGNTLQYRLIDNESGSLYAGAGVSLMFANEQLKASASYGGDTIDVEAKARVEPTLGFRLLAGAEIPVSRKDNQETSLYVSGGYNFYGDSETRLEELTIDGEEQNTAYASPMNINLSGFEANIGFRTKYDMD